jgi:hypothetical protein
MKIHYPLDSGEKSQIVKKNMIMVKRKNVSVERKIPIPLILPAS